MGLFGSVHQVRTQGRGGQGGVVGREHELLRLGLRLGVGREVVARVGALGLGLALRVGAVEGDRGRGREHELRHTPCAAGFDDPSGAFHVRLDEDFLGRVVRRQRGHVEHHVHARDVLGDGGVVGGQVGLDAPGAPGLDLRVGPSTEHHDLVAAIEQLLHDVPADVSAAARDEGLHAVRSSPLVHEGEHAVGGVLHHVVPHVGPRVGLGIGEATGPLLAEGHVEAEVGIAPHEQHGPIGEGGEAIIDAGELGVGRVAGHQRDVLHEAQGGDAVGPASRRAAAGPPWLPRTRPLAVARRVATRAKPLKPRTARGPKPGIFTVAMLGGMRRLNATRRCW